MTAECEKYKKTLERIARHHEGVDFYNLNEEEVKIMKWAANALNWSVITDPFGIIEKMKEK